MSIRSVLPDWLIDKFQLSALNRDEALAFTQRLQTTNCFSSIVVCLVGGWVDTG